MLRYFFRRYLYILMTVWVLSVVSFLIIQLPAGDFVTNLVAQYAQQGRDIDQAKLDNLRQRFGLDRPVYVQYLRWATNVLQGDLGWSFQSQQTVKEAIGLVRPGLRVQTTPRIACS